MKNLIASLKKNCNINARLQMKRLLQRDAFTNLLGIGTFDTIMLTNHYPSVKVDDWLVLQINDTWGVKHESWVSHKILDPLLIRDLVHNRVELTF